MIDLLAIPLAALAGTGFQASSAPVSEPVRAEVKAAGDWRPGCPVGFSELRTLTVTHWDWDGQRATGRLIVNRKAVRPLTSVFKQLYGLRFPIRHMSIVSAYGPRSRAPKSTDVSGTFECRRAVPSPCGSGTGNWSNHAYGMALDLNPAENPYVGCGMSRDPAAQKYRDRRHHRKGMVTARAVGAFRSVGWGWGGSWSGDTKDYMHFSPSGH